MRHQGNSCFGSIKTLDNLCTLSFGDSAANKDDVAVYSPGKEIEKIGGEKQLIARRYRRTIDKLKNGEGTTVDEDFCHDSDTHARRQKRKWIRNLGVLVLVGRSLRPF